MNFIAKVNIMLREQVLDVQGQSVENILKKTNMESIENVRIGKHITFNVSANTEDEAHDKVKLACEKLLYNPVIETYTFSLSKS